MKILIEAAIFDLDGVITKTASQHAKAWKKVFDQYNSWRKDEGESTFSPFSIEKDYPKYIDGIPRYDGTAEFLKSRNIELPFGASNEEEGFKTICGIGNRKNHLFQEIISEEGVEVFEKNVAQVRKWKENGMRTAIISSSKNCKQILEATGLEYLFEVRIDGVICAERNIPGKPAPDIFLEAASKLNIPPEKALIVEDAQAGVRAGKAGGFGLVIGIKNASNEEELLQNGADVVVDNLQELKVEFRKGKNPEELPSALGHFQEIAAQFETEPPLLFLDFDGTLSPIVEHHNDAFISEEMRDLVHKLSTKYPVAVVSGRGLADVRKRVNLPDLFYAGSHGFEISGPNDFSKDHEEAVKVIPVFDEIEPILQKKLQHIAGVDFERKKFTLAIHYRQVSIEEEPAVHTIVAEVLKTYPEIIKSDGKKVIEIRPAIDWHKGKAVEFLKGQLSSRENPLSIYVGDDVTDEDAFREVKNGLGILVGEHSQKTYADYRVEDLAGVKRLFQKFLEHKIG